MSNYGSDHGPRERRGFRGTAENAKTVLCTRFISPEGCRFGDRCNFAHTDTELKPRRHRFGYGAGAGNGNGGGPGSGGAPPGGGPGAGRGGGGRDPWGGRGENAWQGQGGSAGGQYGQYNGGGQYPDQQAPRPEGNAWGKPGQAGQPRSNEEYRQFNANSPMGPQGGAGKDYTLWGGRGGGGFGGIGDGMGGEGQGGYGGGQPPAGGGTWSAQGRGDAYGPRGGNAWTGQGDKRGGAQQQYPQQQMGGGAPAAADHGWSAHSSPQGHCYYYNSRTGTSQWDRPAELGPN
eukprot:1126287-Pyramimonas_sp.AAC.3